MGMEETSTLGELGSHEATEGRQQGTPAMGDNERADDGKKALKRLLYSQLRIPQCS